MRFTKSLDIALMTLIQLATARKQLSTAELSGVLHSPRNHIAKVIQILARGGFIQTVRGKGGGIRLAREPGRILVQEVFDLIEGPVCLIECIVNPDVCLFSLNCRLRLKLREAQENMTSVFRFTTLAELLPVTG
ncbi:MAG: Rrf2 family transcriptional regulator [Acidobacteriota bacterium]